MVFNIRNIFDNSTPDGLLTQNEASHYYIAPYQRGYKWGSAGPNDPVCLLMKDVLEAAQVPNSEYFLQFITTKISESSGKKVLEVIDGQQRLTTLTILLCIISHLKDKAQSSIAANLLSYEVRPKVSEFFADHIYKNLENIVGVKWDQYILKHPNHDEQDIFYLFNAANTIYTILNQDIVDIIAFEKYLLENVKLISNNVDRNTNCEEMFSNLNDNKIELTSSDLIKGLILTKAARENDDPGRLIQYKEILEVRAVMGRQWDELTRWINRKEINCFFFNHEENAFDSMILLLAKTYGFKHQKEQVEKNEVFNFFQTLIKKNGSQTIKYFQELKILKHILNDWYNDKDLHNLLGYLLFAKKNSYTIENTIGLFKAKKSLIKRALRDESLKQLPEDVTTLEYGLNNNEIFNVLLALSVFTDEKFNFTAFSDQSTRWSLEHIFPQKPDELPSLLRTKDLILLNSLAEGKLSDFESIKYIVADLDDIDNIEQVYKSLSEKMKQSECEISLDEKRVLYRLIKVEKLNSIGNMALLTGSDNSSNRNGMFDRKRRNIAKRVSQGSFVPKHSYDVFSKLISDKMSPDLSSWTESDIENHESWIKTKLANIKRFQK